MRLLAFIFGLFSLSLLAFASPTSVSATKPPILLAQDLRPVGTPGGLYACQFENFGGTCFYNRPETLKGCSLLLIGNPNNPVAYKPQSLGPDQGGYCDVFKGRVCNDQTRVKRIDYPGARKLTDFPDWDTIRCYDHLNQASSREDIAVEVLIQSEGTIATESHRSRTHVQPNDRTLSFTEHRDVIGHQVAATASKRSEPGGITYYEEENFGGATFWQAPARKCMKFKFVIQYPDKFQKYVTPKSLKPDKDTFCRLFKGSCREKDQIYYVHSEGLSRAPNYDYVRCCPENEKHACWESDS